MNTIKQLRLQLGLTQEEFGERIGVKRNTVASYEAGNRTPTEQGFLSMCREFNVREEWIKMEPEKCLKIYPRTKKLLLFLEVCLQIQIAKYMILKWRFFES